MKPASRPLGVRQSVSYDNGEDQELVSRRRDLHAGLPDVITELHLVGLIEEFHDSPYLPPHQAVLGEVVQEGDNIQELRIGMHDSPHFAVPR